MSAAARPWTRWWFSVLMVLAASLLLGALTSWAQGFLPEAISSFANSPSGWTILTAALVAAVRPTVGAGAVLGVLSFVSLVLGYTIATELRGLTYNPMFWSVVGIIAGPFIGAASAVLVGRHRIQSAIGAGALAGVLIADGIYGLTVVNLSTSAVYWTICITLGIAIVATTAWRLRSPTAATAAIGTAIAATGMLTAGYAVLNAGY